MSFNRINDPKYNGVIDQIENEEIMFGPKSSSNAKITESYNVDAISKYMNTVSIQSNMKWSKADEKIVQNYIIKALAYKTMYNQAYFRYIFYYRLILFPLVVCTCVTIALQTINTTIVTIASHDIYGIPLSIVSAVFSAGVAILTYLMIKTKYQSTYAGCKKAAGAFTDLADQLVTILEIKREYRINPLATIQMMDSDFKKIIKLYSYYEIPSSIYKKFLDKNKDNSVIVDMAACNNNNFKLDESVLSTNIIVKNFLDSIEHMPIKSDINSYTDCSEDSPKTSYMETPRSPHYETPRSPRSPHYETPRSPRSPLADHVVVRVDDDSLQSPRDEDHVVVRIDDDL